MEKKMFGEEKLFLILQKCNSRSLTFFPSLITFKRKELETCAWWHNLPLSQSFQRLSEADGSLSPRFSLPLPALFAGFARAFCRLCPRFLLALLAPSAAFARALRCLRSHTLLRQFSSVSLIYCNTARLQSKLFKRGIRMPFGMGLKGMR